MMVEKINKHELRTRQTRALLLKAAETVFARDGYEGAELGEIAALAGRTKGAIYAQFASKEEIFLAMVEERRDGDRAEMQQALSPTGSVEENIKALRRFYLKLVDQPRWGLLLLEFKLFAMRHPQAQKRLQELMAVTNSKEDEKRVVELLGAPSAASHGIGRMVAVQTMLPMLSALMLEAKVQAPQLDNAMVRKVASQIFDALLGIETPTPE